jgi:diaminohydroxyphosphoribosylaminopyrimidine deaminase / 5-amino-6-(5-phosphoribosylamino)uracil reductase
VVESFDGRSENDQRVTHGSAMTTQPRDHEHILQAIAVADAARCTVSPRPWVGAVVVDGDDQVVGSGATRGRRGPHAEVVALAEAGAAARGATIYVTLEPCGFHGVTPPCVDAVVEAGIRRVVVALEDPDPRVAGAGLAALRAKGLDVVTGVGASEATAQLLPYLTHRRTGRPYVVLKLAATADGRTGAPDGTSQWITGEAARADAHRLRAQSDAVLVGAGTMRTDDPSLTVRVAEIVADPEFRQPLRVVLGHAPDGARAQPVVELHGELDDVLDQLGERGVLQVLVEGGATVAHAFHHAGLVDRYVLYVAPAFLGGDDGSPLFRGPGAATIADLWQGELVDTRRLGSDLRLDIVPRADGAPAGEEA